MSANDEYITINEDVVINKTLTVAEDITAIQDLHVRGWLYAANVANIYKGTFPSLEALVARWPDAICEDGWVAGVTTMVENENVIIAYSFDSEHEPVDNTHWINTGATLNIDGSTIVDYNNKVDKVGSATVGNFASFVSGGGIADSGHNHSDYAPLTHTHGNILNEGTIDTSSATAIKNKDKLIVLENGRDIVGRNVEFDGTTAGRALTKKGTFEAFLTSHQDISGKADKVSSPTNGNLVSMNGSGNLTNSGKKAADFENVSNKVISFSNPTNTQYPSAYLTYYSILEFMGLSVNEAVRVTFRPSEDGGQDVLNNDVMEDVKLIVKDGSNYTSNNIDLIGGEDNVVSFVFKDPSTIPAKAFLDIENITSVHIPSFVHAIGDTAFLATTLENIECEGMTPPTLGDSVFPSSVAHVKMHDVVKDKYSGEGGNWGDFTESVFETF